MLSVQTADAVMVWAPAKVNLFLEVLAKRPDGYHDIATLMLAVGLYDTLEFTEDTPGDVRLQTDHPNLTTGPDNLICKAVNVLRQHSGCPHGVRVSLRKRIPMAAGLAGGSADAAATLLGLNRLWGLNYSPSQLASLGAQVGSDVAFFFALPAAWCTGRVEIVRPVTLGQPLWFVLVSGRGSVHGGGLWWRSGAGATADRRRHPEGPGPGRPDGNREPPAQPAAGAGRAVV